MVAGFGQAPAPNSAATVAQLSVGPSVVTASKFDVARRMIDEGQTINEVCATIGVSRTTLYRHLRQVRQQASAESAH